METAEASRELLRDDVLTALEAIGAASQEDADIDHLLHVIADQVCALFDVRRCSVYLAEPETGRFRGRVAHADGDVDEAIRRLVAGTDADRFTREIVLRKEPVFIADAAQDSRPVRGTMRAWGVCSMLGVPMVAQDEIVGLLYLDNEENRVDLSSDERRLVAKIADLAATTIAQVQRAAELRQRIIVEARKNRLLHQTSQIERRLVAMVTAGAELEQVLEWIARLTSKPVAVYAGDGSLVGRGDPPGGSVATIPSDLSHVDVRFAIAAAGDGGGSVGPFVAAGVNHRLQVTPLPGDEAGHVVIVEGRDRLSRADALVGRSTAVTVALIRSIERRSVEAEAQIHRTLARDLLLGRDDPDDLTRRAAAQNVCVEGQAHVVCLFASRDPLLARTLSAGEVHAAFPLSYRGAPVITAAVEGGIAAFLPVEGDDHRAAIADVKRVVKAVAAALSPTGEIIAAVSRSCHRVEDFARSRGECDQIIQCFSSFVDRADVTVITADELGPARLVLATGSPAVVTRFAEDVLGPVAYPAGGGPELLATLAAYFESERSPRHAGLLLDVHENTVRYRMAKISKLTGLDLLTSADDELTAQMAVTVLRMQGRIPTAIPEVADAA